MIGVTPRSKPAKKGGQNWYIEYYDATRTPKALWRSLRTQSARVARQYVAQIEQKIALEGFDPWSGEDPFASDRAPAPPLVTVGQAVERYLTARAPINRPSTQRIRVSRLGNVFASPEELGSRDIRALTPDDIERFLLARTGRGGGDAMPATVQSYYAALFGFFTWCVEQSLVDAHPLETIDEPDVPDSAFHVFTPEEMKRIDDAVCAQTSTTGHMRHRAFLRDLVEVAVCSGLRVSELVGLTARTVDVDGDQVTLTVRNYMGGRGKSARLTKTGKARSVPIFPRGAAAMLRLLERFEEKSGRKPKPSDQVLLGAYGKPLSEQAASKYFREALVVAGIEDASFHDLRHTFISWGVNELQLPLTVVQRLAGHADIRRTASYQRVTHRTIRESMNRAYAQAGIGPATHDPDAGYIRVARYVAGV